MDQHDLGDSFLTVAEVAETLKLNQQTVRNWIDQGSLPALRVGRRVRIRRSDFERLLAESYTAAAGGAGANAGPSAEDFWGGEPVGLPEQTATAATSAAATSVAATSAGATSAAAPASETDADLREPVAGVENG
jgi:excisionase family DNA binding protein